jgi:hypothetical protein
MSFLAAFALLSFSAGLLWLLFDVSERLAASGRHHAGLWLLDLVVAGFVAWLMGLIVFLFSAGQHLLRWLGQG